MIILGTLNTSATQCIVLELFISLTLISSNLIIGLLDILFQLFIMICRTPFEEKMLANHFGKEYHNYKMQMDKFSCIFFSY
jgi:protein-S-isoprenylcysteine O-methyltransferase Ste14